MRTTVELEVNSLKDIKKRVKDLVRKTGVNPKRIRTISIQHGLSLIEKDPTVLTTQIAKSIKTA